MLVKFSKLMHQHSETGNTTMIALVLTAAAMVGISQMLDSSVLTRQMIANQDLNNQQKDTPRSATILAKALINRPASVETNLKDNWTSDGIKANKSRLPAIYPSPYVAGSSGSPAAIPTFLSKSASTSDAIIPFDASTVSTTNKIKVYSLDSGRSANANFDKAFVNPGYAVNNADEASVIPRSESRVTYQLNNCNKEDGSPSTTYTGYYCASADIESDTYSKASNGTLTKSTVVNKGTASLGMIPVPPAPTCGLVTSSSGATGTISPGNNFDLLVTASGIAVGYSISLKIDGKVIGAPIESPNGMMAYKWNTLGADATETIRIDTDPYQSQMPLNSKLTADVRLTGIDGKTTTCPGSLSLNIISDKPSCEVRPVQAVKEYKPYPTPCNRAGNAPGLIVKINGSIPVTANPVIRTYAGRKTNIPVASWKTIASWDIDQGYPCKDGPCFWGEMPAEDVLEPGMYRVSITGTNGQTNTCSAFLFGGYDNGWRCSQSYTSTKIANLARDQADTLNIPFPVVDRPAMVNNSDTATKICSMVGLGKKVGYRASLSSERRTNFSTPHDNQLIEWNGSSFVAHNAYGYSWMGSLVCN